MTPKRKMILVEDLKKDQHYCEPETFLENIIETLENVVSSSKNAINKIKKREGLNLNYDDAIPKLESEIKDYIQV